MSVSALLNGILDINVKKITTNEVSSNGGNILIDALNGKLEINGTNGNILIDGTTTFVGNNHIGEATIEDTHTQVVVPFNGMNNDAIILLTSRNSVSSLWVVAGTNQFIIETATPVAADTKVNYFILKYN
jgi:hypothetical protein